MQSLIEIKNLKHSYIDTDGNEIHALNGVSLDIYKGEFIAVIGANGSGKSTLARHLNALLLPTEGKCIVAGMDTADDKNLWNIRQHVGMVFQNPDNQFVGATVEDDVAFGLENQGLSRQEMQKRVEEALDLVGMLDFKKREPARLSGGQKQRVAIAGVVALRPAILILDEATSMLDPEGRRELIETVKGIRKDYDMTVISITHDLEEVAMSDRVLVMKKGEIESTSGPRELFSRNDLDQIGLDDPFSNQLKHSLSQNGYDLPENY